jgi:hypothetical protein
VSRGDHLYARRRRRYSRYTHHGIDCGDGTVIHYAGERRGGRRVERSSWQAFAQGSRVQVRPHRRRGLPADEVVAKAESRLGADGYHLVWNNCEHFATWCSTGNKGSKQVRGWVMAAPGGALASFSAADVVGAHLILIGSVFMGGCYAVTKPLQRRRHRRRRAGSGAPDRDALPQADPTA